MLVGGLSLQPPACTMPFMPPCSNLEATGAACLPVPSSGRENLAATVGKQLTTTPVARVVRLVVFDDILVWSYQEEKTDENTAKPCVHSVTPCVFGMRVMNREIFSDRPTGIHCQLKPAWPLQLPVRVPALHPLHFQSAANSTPIRCLAAVGSVAGPVGVQVRPVNCQ